MSEDTQGGSGGFLPKIEVLLLVLLLAIFLVWGISRCNSRNAELEQLEALNTPDSLAEVGLSKEPPNQSGALDLVDSRVSQNGPSSQSNEHQKASTSSGQNLPVLFVTINGLNLRTGPHLDSLVILKLPLYEKVWYLGAYTDFVDTINLGYIEAVEPWFKVRHKKGHEGWVYGAGVDFYKYKREGVLE